MAYRLNAAESLPDGVRRIAREQIDRAVGALTDGRTDRHEAVHQARKRFKKIRGLLRLVRAELGDAYGAENTWYRDTARRLSAVRDAEAMIETFDTLLAVFDDQVQTAAFGSVRQGLVERRRIVADEDVDLERRVSEIAACLGKARARVATWPLSTDGFEAVAPGFKRTYRRGRKALMTACRRGTDEDFHEWRKRVKYHWYHVRLLRNVWPTMMNAARHAAKDLADLLGDDHDLVVLRDALRERPGAFGAPRDVQALIGLIDRRRTALQTRAGDLGRRLYADKPKAMLRRAAAWWQAWQDEARRAEILAPPD